MFVNLHLHALTVLTMSEGRGIGQVIVLSGGSGYNNLVGATPSAIYVMPGT